MIRALILALLCACVFAATPARAQQGVQVFPVILDIPTARGVAAMRVSNQRGRETAFEMSAFVWSQGERGEDILTPTNDLLLSPSVFLIPPQGEQIVRIGAPPALRGGARERAYRVVLRELPNGAAPQNGFRILLEMSMPVFLRPAHASGLLHVTRSGDQLVYENRGAAHIVLSGANADAPRYLLAGSRVLRPLAAPIPSLTLTAATGDEPPRPQSFDLSDAPVLAGLR